MLTKTRTRLTELKSPVNYNDTAAHVNNKWRPLQATATACGIEGVQLARYLQALCIGTAICGPSSLAPATLVGRARMQMLTCPCLQISAYFLPET